MSDISEIEKRKLEKVFSMHGGYVIDFTNQSFQNYIQNTIGINIYAEKYSEYGDSKAKRLKSLWKNENNNIVGKLIENMLQYYKETIHLNDQENSVNIDLYNDSLKIAYRLLGKTPKINNESNIDDFLKKEVDEVPLSNIGLEISIEKILEERIVEVKKCLKYEIPLSAIFLCGSILEGILLGTALTKIKEFNQSLISPKNKNTGKVKQFHEWTLSNFIDVAFDLKMIGLDVKKHSHSLRDFRNYIHPYEQVSSNFRPDNHTARICWQVLKAALHDLSNKK